MKHPSPMLPHSSAFLAPYHLPEWMTLILQEVTSIMLLTEFRVAQDLEGVIWPTGRMDYFAMALPATVFETVMPIFLRCLAKSIFNWSLLRALLSSRLKALDESPEIGPIGVVETLRHVICNPICLITTDDAECVSVCQSCFVPVCGVVLRVLFMLLLIYSTIMIMVF